MALYQLLDLSNLGRPEAPTDLKTNRVQPELGRTVIPLDMNVGRLAPIAGIEEEAIGPCPQYCRHHFTLAEAGSRDEIFTVSGLTIKLTCLGHRKSLMSRETV